MGRTPAASVYGIGDRILLEGHAFLPEMGCDTPTTCLHVLDATDVTDEEIGSSLLAVLARYGKDEHRSDERALLKVAGVSSRTRLTRQAAFVSVVQHPDRIELSPWRRHPSGGWTGNVDDPVLQVSSEDPADLGAELRTALTVADDLPRDRRT